MRDAVLKEFSARTAGVQRRIDEKLDRFIDTFDRDPTPRERWRLEREAVVDSRPPKAHDIDAATLHDGWRAQVEALGLERHQVVEYPRGRAPAYGLQKLQARRPWRVSVRVSELSSPHPLDWGPVRTCRWCIPRPVFASRQRTV